MRDVFWQSGTFDTVIPSPGDQGVRSPIGFLPIGDDVIGLNVLNWSWLAAKGMLLNFIALQRVKQAASLRNRLIIDLYFKTRLTDFLKETTRIFSV